MSTIINIDLGPKDKQTLANLETVKTTLSNIRKEIIIDLHNKKISKGDLNMQINLSNSGGRLDGNDYAYYLWKGRRPGKMPPISAIDKWLKKKGITGRNVKGRFITRRSLAFLIARKIGKLGTDIYLGRRPGLALESIVNINSEKLFAAIAKTEHDAVTDMFRAAIEHTLKNKK